MGCDHTEACGLTSPAYRSEVPVRAVWNGTESSYSRISLGESVRVDGFFPRLRLDGEHRYDQHRMLQPRWAACALIRRVLRDDMRQRHGRTMLETCPAGRWLSLSPLLASNATNIQPDTPAEFPASMVYIVF